MASSTQANSAALRAELSASQAAEEASRARSRRRWRRALHSLRRDPSAIFGLIILSIVVFAALFAPWISPHDPGLVDPLKRLLPPFWSEPQGSMEHILGTDAVGRDILSRIIYGARISIFIGAAVIVLATGVGILAGLAAGYLRGWVDVVISRVVDILLGFPYLIFAIGLMAMMGPGLLNIVLALAYKESPIRASCAARCWCGGKRSTSRRRVNGCRDVRIIRNHILPNVFSSILVIFTLQVAFVLILESGLSFLGLGVEPTIPTWGSMLNEGATTS